jgi:hypothetical protein
MILPSSSVPIGDADGLPSIRYEKLTWHHDCSNTTDFELNSTWDLSWHQGWEFVDGPLLCDGDSFSLFSGPVNGHEFLWRGPVFMLELPQKFSLDEFISLSVDFEISNIGDPEEESLCYVHLVDSNYDPIITLFWTDNFQLNNLMRYGVKYWNSEQSNTGFTTNPVYNQTLHYESVISKGDDSKLMFSIPTIENQELFVPPEEENLRNITHVIIMYGSCNRWSLVQSFLHDITLEFNHIIQYDPSLIDAIDSPNPGEAFRTIHPSTLFAWGLSFVSVTVIIIFTSRTLPHITEDD